MNPMQQMKDPSAGVPRELLPHLHLVSKNRYPVTNNPSLETIVAYLLEAPKVIRESTPVQWQYLDCPQDGTLFLTWQPPDLGAAFASDGYVWADLEAPFNSDVRGYTLQMYMHKSGFRPQGDAMASHSRRRYRLLPSQQSVGGPMPDPSLWLIHYSKAAPRDQVAAATVPVPHQVHAQLQQRRLIMGAGALARKEFMLPDRGNWPTINLPGNLGRHAAAAAAQLGGAHRRGPSMAGHEPTIEEEEDVSRGDALDFMTPRDISRMRYEQHHEWMEEILESPYRTMQIVPPTLGLGRKGELEILTKDFFDAPIGVSQDVNADGTVPRVGRLDAGRAEEFTKLANQKLAAMQQELQKMKVAHKKRMEQLKKVTTLSAAEKKLRSAVSESSQRKSSTAGLLNAGAIDPDALDEIVKEVEATTGRKIERVKNVACVSKGGYQELQVAATPATEQITNAVASAKPVAVPTNTIQPQTSTQPNPQALPQGSGDNSSQNGVLPRNTSPTANNQPVLQKEESQEQPSGPDMLDDDGGMDIEMGGYDDQPSAEDGVGDANDWVMVDDNNMGENIGTPSLDQLTKDLGDSDQAQDETPLDAGFTPGASANQTPQANEQQQRQPSEPQITGHTPLDTGDFDFDDVNTAGDALADYGADDDLNLDNLDNMDDSAFGDAFHPNDGHHLT